MPSQSISASRALVVFAALAALLFAVSPRAAFGAEPRPRVIVTTDGEGDDIASMHRFLLYANDFDVEGIVPSASRWHWAGDPTANPPIATNNWHGTSWIPELIDQGYRQSYPKLVANDPRYPTPEQLISLYKIGNITVAGEIAKDTPGSDLIKQVLLDDDPGEVHLQAWGGTNTIAAALRSIRSQYHGTPQWDAIYRKVSDKAVVYAIQDQDLAVLSYVEPVWPDVRTIINRDQFEGFAYGWRVNKPESIRNLFRSAFITPNIVKGPLGSTYPVTGGPHGNGIGCPNPCPPGDWFSEGDSPSFLHTIPTGLRNLENPSYGGWGGRFAEVKPRLWVDEPFYVGLPDRRVTDRTPLPVVNTTLAAGSNAGATNVKITRASSTGSSGIASMQQFVTGDRVTIGSGATAETRTVTNAGTAVSPNTNLADAASAGATNIKVNSVGNAANAYGPGASLNIGTGATQEVVTITAVDRARVQTTLSAPVEAGATSIKVANVGATCNVPSGICVTLSTVKPGDTLYVGTGAARVTAKITAIGTPGANGSGFTLDGPLPAGFASGATVVALGGGISFTPALATNHAAGEAVTSLGSGLTLDAPLTQAHATLEPIISHSSPHWAQVRWDEAIQNDMAARIDWTIKDYADANHQPVPSVASRDLVVPAGTRVNLSGSAVDPDGDEVVFSWYQYREAGTYDGDVVVENAATRTPSFVMPANARAGETVHVILAVTDRGTPALTRYERVIVKAATPVSGGVGGTVPATLGLTLGAPATLGVFTPGITRTYLGSSSANVVSTAGDATLSVADPSSVATGRLVNGSFALTQPLQLRARNAANTGTAYNNVGSSASPLNLLTWSAPVSNDAVTLEYSQLVNANEPLRTGSYSKTLTFTLSTATP